MRTISILSPQKTAIGAGCVLQCADDLLNLGLRRFFVVTSIPIVDLIEPFADALKAGGAVVEIFSGVNSEPSVALFEVTLAAARAMQPDAVIGFGGGSPMDTAKVVAALWNGEQSILDVFGIDRLKGRSTYLALIPTMSGASSEVTPYAIFHHEEEQLKKGVVSPHIVPDASYVDPALTVTKPPAVTASTGMDAMTHCIEAYVNKYAHPMVDMYALAGIS